MPYTRFDNNSKFIPPYYFPNRIYAGMDTEQQHHWSRAIDNLIAQLKHLSHRPNRFRNNFDFNIPTNEGSTNELEVLIHTLETKLITPQQLFEEVFTCIGKYRYWHNENLS